MTWITLIGPPRNGETVEILNMKEGMTIAVGVFSWDCEHQLTKPMKAFNVTYHHYRGNIFKSELGSGDFFSQLCVDCLVEARLRVLTKHLEDHRYTKKYKKELKRIAESEEGWDYDRD